MFYRAILRPLVFHATRNDPELAHTAALTALATLSRSPFVLRQLQRTWQRANPALERTVCGIRFPNPVGLAAGYDKDGTALPGLAAFGFGHIEVGTVTWRAQAGNPRPRLFRLESSQALVNRMGFNNAGAAALAERLHRLGRLPIPLGISLGKSRSTPLDEAVDDYSASYRLLSPYADYIAINVSSPNTPGLRSLQDRVQLETLLAVLRHESYARAQQQANVPPLLLKIAPDLSESALLEVLDVGRAYDIGGIIATNTTLSRAGVHPADAERAAHEAGGLSGRPLAETALRVVGFLHRETGGQVPIIGVGGICSADDALRMVEAGASLVQVYTGFVYAGPRLVRDMNDALLQGVSQRVTYRSG